MREDEIGITDAEWALIDALKVIIAEIAPNAAATVESLEKRFAALKAEYLQDRRVQAPYVAEILRAFAASQSPSA